MGTETDRSTGAVILAAGRSELNGELTPMLSLGQTTMIQREIDTLRKAGISPIVVVTGYMAEELEKHISHRGVIFVRNEGFDSTEMLDSVKIGLRALPEKTDRVMLFPADVPMVHAETVEKIAEASGEASVPSYEGRLGHPLGISKRLIEGILSYQGSEGLRGAIREAGIGVQEIPVQDPGVLIDTNTMSDYDRALELEELRRQENAPWFHCGMTLGRETEAFGELTASFLEAVGELGSMLGACERCGISYSKGWKMVKTAEEQFNLSFLTKQPGGARGGSSELTPEGRRFLSAYRAFSERVRDYADSIFGEYTADLFEDGKMKKH